MRSNVAQRLVGRHNAVTATNTRVTADSADGQKGHMSPWISAESEGRTTLFPSSAWMVHPPRAASVATHAELRNRNCPTIAVLDDRLKGSTAGLCTRRQHPRARGM
jgi:hypothetical protein